MRSIQTEYQLPSLEDQGGPVEDYFPVLVVGIDQEVIDQVDHVRIPEKFAVLKFAKEFEPALPFAFMSRIH